MYFPSLNFD